MSLWRKRQLFRRLAELPRQQVTSPYSCMILIISHMAEGRVGHRSGRRSPCRALGRDPQHRRQGSGLPFVTILPNPTTLLTPRMGTPTAPAH